MHLQAGLLPEEDHDASRSFLHGGEIDWYELHLNIDVERDVTPYVLRVVRGDLDSNRTIRFNLSHDAGAGGTTVGRRVAWDLHREYPTGMLRRTVDPQSTAERLRRIVALTGKPVMLTVDSSEITGRQIDELFEHARARRLPVVFLQVLRRLSIPGSDFVQGERARYLKSDLSDSEANRFVFVLSREEPGKRRELERLRNSVNKQMRSPFYFCLQAFEDRFLGIPSYVASHIAGLSEPQRRILGLLAIAHHYGQRALPEDAFRELLSLPPASPVDLREALPAYALNLVVEGSARSWRTTHDLIAKELLVQLLTPDGGDPRTWSQGLSNWAIEFARFCRGKAPVPSEELLETVRRIFVYRDNNEEVLGTERAGQRQLSLLLEAIPADPGKLRVLSELVSLYPEEAHFWAHLGRFYAVRNKDYLKALDNIDHAISLQPSDHVLHHMRGMATRSRLYDLISEQAPLEDLIPLAVSASESFARARELGPDDDYAYISEVQMLARILAYSAASHPTGLARFVALPSTDNFLREALQQAEDLLEQVRRNREGERPSEYEARCRADLDALYGEHDSAIQIWNNLLDRPGIYAPPLRRQIAWAYLARRGRAWDKLQQHEVDRIVELMRDNLELKPDDDKSLRLWLQAVRRSRHPLMLEAAIEKVAYWKANGDSLDATYYLYVLYTLSALEGSAGAIDYAIRNLDECKARARFRRNRDKSFEWLGRGQGLQRLVHHSLLGEWDREADFWTNPAPLDRIEGRITKWDGPQAGRIEIAWNLSAFFVPAKGKRDGDRSFQRADVSRRVTFYLGFSYDGLRAWEVRDASGT